MTVMTTTTATTPTTNPIQQNPVLLMALPTSRSVSPQSPGREMRGIRLFRAISRRLARKSQQPEEEERDVDSRSSSTDSCSSTSAGRCSRPKKEVDSGFRSASPNHMSSSSSEAGSDIQQRPRHHHHSTSAESIRKVFQHLNLNARSHSCNGASKETKRKAAKTSAAPKRILRTPMTYTYVRGLSGLPTQRVPKCPVKIVASGYCGCSMQYMSGLHR